jgi:atypical dual specificity phosphatase
LFDTAYLHEGSSSMWTWSLNWGEISPTIVVGTCPMTPHDLERIRDEAGVSAVLSLQHDDCQAYWSIDFAKMAMAASRLGLVFGRHSIRDLDVEDMRRQLPAAVALLAKLQAAGHRTYVHCTAGLGRAPLIVLGFLILVQGWDPEDAIQLILQGRPGAVPAWEALHGCVEDLAARHRRAIERRAYELYESGVHGNANADWLAAQAEVLCAALLQMDVDGIVPAHRAACREHPGRPLVDAM